MDKCRNDYICKLNNLAPKEFMFETLKYNIAPTIYGEKSSTLLNFSSKNKNQYNFWRKYKNEFLDNLNLNLYELKSSENNVIELFYNEKLLKRILENKECIKFLTNFGYPQNINVMDSLNMLKFRYNKGLPHEIGLFLGFPLWDVVDYIKNYGKNYIYCGYWKVYSNLNYALDMFERYNNAKFKALNDLKLSGCSKY